MSRINQNADFMIEKLNDILTTMLFLSFAYYAIMYAAFGLVQAFESTVVFGLVYLVWDRFIHFLEYENV